MRGGFATLVSKEKREKLECAPKVGQLGVKGLR